MFDTVEAAQEKLCPQYRVFEPESEEVSVYDDLYALYRDLYFAFGEKHSAFGKVLPKLIEITQRTRTSVRPKENG